MRNTRKQFLLERLEDRAVPAFTSPVQPDDLPGFSVSGVQADELVGHSVANAGDVNADGINDFLVGGPGTDSTRGSNAGQAYVIFGTEQGFPQNIDVDDDLISSNGSLGFVLDGEAAGDQAGLSVSGAGDVNGDGIADLIVGAPFANRNGLSDSGAAYVVFGRSTPFPTRLDLGTLDGSNGFQLSGVQKEEFIGFAVAGAGDFNGDGFDEVIISGHGTDSTRGSNAGQAYVIYGTDTGFPANINLDDDIVSSGGDIGFVLDGKAAGDHLGISVAGAGDLNGDGLADLVVGANSADVDGLSNAGQAYVVFGSKSPFPTRLNVENLDGTNGFTVSGVQVGSVVGRAVAGAGDVNGDGFDDVLVSGHDVDSTRGNSAGQAYVIFGGAGPFPMDIKADDDLVTAQGKLGFVLDGIAAIDRLGFGIQNAGGDVNADGIDDLIVGAYTSNEGGSRTGRAFVVFGGTDPFPTRLNMDQLDGTNGFELRGLSPGDQAGWSVSLLGDINGDRVADIIVGAKTATVDGADKGQAYVVYGQDDIAPVAMLAGEPIVNVIPIVGRTYTISVTYTDVAGVSTDTFDNENLVLLSPANEPIPTQFVGIDPTAMGPGVTALYQVIAPGEGLAQGDYDIMLISNEIEDLSGNKSKGGILGSFTVDGTITPPGGPGGPGTPGGGGSPNVVAQFAVGSGPAGSGQVTVYNPDGTVAYQINAFASTPGGVRTAMADITGDGTEDLIVGVGPGAVPQVKIYDGATQQLIQTIDAFEASFLGGVYVAAGDTNGDGRADVVITPDEGGGPRVRIFSGDGFGQLQDFFGIDDPNFRGGARPALGDLNGDGIADLLVAAGFGGGPRVAGFNGTSLAGGPTKLFPDFFIFEQALRNGAFIGSGDLNGDGFDDIIGGGGPGGGPRVFALSGADILNGGQTQLANFFAGNVDNRGGVRVTAKDLDGDEFDDLVVGDGTDAGSRVTSYLGTSISPDGTPPENYGFDAIAGFTNGVFVG